jgi:hypothetical protein
MATQLWPTCLQVQRNRSASGADILAPRQKQIFSAFLRAIFAALLIEICPELLFAI